MLLLFGMPGTGKSTTARYLSPSIEFDYGAHFLESLSELFGEKVANRVIRSHTQLLQVLPRNMVISSFPSYFDLSRIPSHVTVVFAIPEVHDMDEILNRLHQRKDHPLFSEIDKLTLLKWRKGWLDTYYQYCRMAEVNGFQVHRVSLYNFEDLSKYREWNDEYVRSLECAKFADLNKYCDRNEEPNFAPNVGKIGGNRND